MELGLGTRSEAEVCADAAVNHAPHLLAPSFTAGYPSSSCGALRGRGGRVEDWGGGIGVGGGLGEAAAAALREVLPEDGGECT